MLFNSYLYILFFLPLTIFGYFTLCRLRLLLAAKSWLVLTSLAFYSYWNPAYLALIMASMLVNYAIGSVLSSQDTSHLLRVVPRKMVLIVAVVINLSVLGYYKYADFFLENFNA
ncbi:MAG: MBOAT family protein, partial [Desulfuromonadales bacterium]|nr:MBOAT family protein [Desulfuromonadales bacterium]